MIYLPLRVKDCVGNIFTLKIGIIGWPNEQAAGDLRPRSSGPRRHQRREAMQVIPGSAPGLLAGGAEHQGLSPDRKKGIKL